MRGGRRLEELIKEIEALKKRVAALEGQVQAQPVKSNTVKVKINNLGQLTELINETTQSLEKIKNFKLVAEVS